MTPIVALVAFAAALPPQMQTPVPRPAPQLSPSETRERLPAPTPTPEDDRLFLMVSVQLATAATTAVVLAPIALGVPFVATQTLVPQQDIGAGALLLLSSALVAAPLFAMAVGTLTSIGGSLFARRVAPGFRALTSGAAGALTAGICAGGLATALLASLPLAGAAVFFWAVGLPLTAVGGAATGAIVAVYLEGRDLLATETASPIPATPRPLPMRF